ncbi:MAG: hypothetical protein CSA70_09940 [Rhodobacterales bacterium]|nr:MAG: hypothetical protein CSA70_09940 [Rhodobacterales bacterium]
MQCYSLHSDLDQTWPGYTFQLAPGDAIVRGDLKTGRKPSTFTATAFDEDWRFDPATRAALPDLSLFINMASPNLPDIMGSYAAVPLRDETQGPIAISERFHAALADVLGDAMDTVTAGPLIDQLSGRKIVDHDFVHLAVAVERDTYVHDRITVDTFTRDDGRTITSVRDISTHNPHRVAEGVIWREALDGALRCSERFKAIYDDIGGRGLHFQPTNMFPSGLLR